MLNRLFGVSSCLFCMAGLLTQELRGPDTPLHRFTFDEQFENEVALSQFQLAPDGNALAWVKARPITMRPATAQNALVLPHVDSDIWITEGRHAPARNLTNGLSDHSGSWAPRWSSDGQRLAFLSSRGGNVTLWVWERGSNRVRQLSTEGIDYLRVDRNQSFQWIDDRYLLCLALPEGRPSRPLSLMGLVVQRATHAWESAQIGESATASVVNSLEFTYPIRRLLLLDALTGTARLIGFTVSEEPEEGTPPWPRFWLSPNSKTVALVKPGPTIYGAVSLSRLGFPRAIELRSLDGEAIRLEKPLPDNVLTETLSWSPDGREVVFFAYGTRPVNPAVLYGTVSAEVMPEFIDAPSASVQNPARLYRVNVQSGRVQEVSTGDVDLGYLGAPYASVNSGRYSNNPPSTFEWTYAGELLFHAPVRKYGVQVFNLVPRHGHHGEIPLGPSATKEWLVLDRSGATRPLTTALKRLPLSLQRIDQGAAFIGIVDGDVWRIDAATGAARNITERFTPSISYIWPVTNSGAPWASRQPKLTHIVVAVGEMTQRDRALLAATRPDLAQVDQWYRLALDGNEAVEIERSDPKAMLNAVSHDSTSGVFVVNDRNGSRMWWSRAWKPELVAEENSYRKRVATGDMKLVEYTSLNGESLRASLTLPVGYTPGRRYPLMVEVYRGTKPAPTPPSLGSWANVAATAGYAYMVPTMPVNLPGLIWEEGESLDMLMDGVLPAVDKAIAMGLVDPDRLFVLGWSSGGWSSVGLVTKTKRFKAAMAGAGYYEFSTVFTVGGALWRGIYMRYADNPHGMAMPNAYANAQKASEMPWWRDGERARRNSPFNYVDRIQTPLLLIHGDLDPVSYEESETLFNALVSQRKPSQFVRYWGEGHSFVSPANIRDMWQRIFAWFDNYGDILRDDNGNMVFSGDRVQSRKGAAALPPEAFASFGPTAHTIKPVTDASRKK